MTDRRSPGSRRRQRRNLLREPAAVVALAFGLWAAAACARGPAAARPAVASQCDRAFVFVDRGRPAARIEIPGNAGEAERRAADILQTSVFRMTGVDLPVLAVAAPDRPGAAAIGFPLDDLPPAAAAALPSLRADGFALVTSAGNLYVVSGGGPGLVRGVVHVLEKYFGCRLDAAAPFFPRRDDLALGCLFEVNNPES
ncbi:MAG TPA: hypothetical protein P5119_04235 [Candidatus Aminicenantes bacterium]|nr:hypothetical protein [Candidatus Aminicenantes bacterium]HRY64533.1 hypothetical protein [Candidatus Aminicenantes bacterium]HRZ71446.1 hypothetical protein [Candidatus Aminicenantes bacterium]